MTLQESKHVALNNRITSKNLLCLTDTLYIHVLKSWLIVCYAVAVCIFREIITG